MTDKEKLDAIRAEIHRLVDVRGYDREMANDLFAFMNSLPNEPVSEELEDAAKSYSDNEDPICTCEECLLKSFKAGAEWQNKQMKEVLRTEYEKGRHDAIEEMMKTAVDGE